ncbi:chorismate-binding protein [Halpernia frigidisoli]|uniref:Isochorismate synthase n=1 Tax=Halpernia frigidisoli TaxID=1125876 RepID=A0A1I3FHD0_9FLAO|nr:chorismate-binding protein [Halpernia frigidisoli]SFI10614.1 isochorismate synthase [Halpernia frigidisoli]
MTQILFRLPFSSKIFVNDLNSENENIGFTSFDTLKQLNFKGNFKEVSPEQLLENQWSSSDFKFTLNDLKEESEEDYIQKLGNVISFIKKNKLPKLVISRRKIIGLENQKINLSQSFLNLIKSYDNAFIYLFKTEEESWIGAFSEVLGKFNKKTSEFETMSLAGTLGLDKEWTKKELDEQKTVSNYVESVLKKYSSQVKISDTKDHHSGNIKHLRTDFKLKIDEEHLSNLITDLHPTPAVCGIPKDFCKKAILNFENKPREFYAGFSRVEMSDDVYFFVNLRCAKVYKNAAELFVGGGITSQSNPQKEWQETELKSEAILKNLSISS